MNNKTTGLVLLLVAAVAGADNGALERSDTANLVDEARLLLSRATATKPSEKRLEQIVLTLGSAADNEDSRRLIEDLASREPAVLVGHEEGTALVPFVDVGAAARFVLRNWERAQAREHAARSLRRGDPAIVPRFFDGDATRRAGILDAVREAPPGLLALHRDETDRRFREAGGDRLAAALGLALGDRELLTRVLRDGTPAVALETVAALEAAIGADAAVAILEHALDQPAIASAALFEIGRMSDVTPGAESVLWERLGDPRLGGSAAAALARGADRDTIDRLAAMLTDGDDLLLERRVLLALRLSDDPRGADIAERWLARSAKSGAE